MLLDRHPYQIITRPEILSLLKRIYDSRAMLTIKINDQDVAYSSSILGINSRKGVFLLDELFPEPPNQPERHSQLHCSCRLDGISINFNCELKHTAEVNANHMHQISMPVLVHYHQRRRHYRVPLSWSGGSVSGVLNQQRFSASLSDISISGICASMEEAEHLDLQRNMDLPNCTLNIPNYITQPVTLRFKSLRMGTLYGQTIFGAEFIHQERGQIKQLTELITQLDREACQIRFLKDEITRIRQAAPSHKRHTA